LIGIDSLFDDVSSYRMKRHLLNGLSLYGLTGIVSIFYETTS